MSDETEPKKSAADRSIGQRISLARRSQSLSQAAMAREIGISWQQLQKYERGANRVSASRLARIADVLGVQVESFYEAKETAGREVDMPGLDEFLLDPRASRLVGVWSKLPPPARTKLCDFIELMVADAGERLSETDPEQHQTPEE